MSLIRRLFGKPTIEDFGDRLVRELRKTEPTNEFRLEISERRIVRIRDGQEAGAINLANIYQTHVQTPRLRRRAHIRHCARVAGSASQKLPSGFSQARRNLRPKLWSRAALEDTRLRQLYTVSDNGGLDLPCQPVGDHLLASLAYDWPESVQSINADDLRDWGVTVYEALEAALENLDSATNGFAKIGDNLYSFVSGDTYDAVRLMLVDRIKAFELDGTPVAIVPNRDCILITESDDNVGLKMMVDLAT